MLRLTLALTVLTTMPSTVIAQGYTENPFYAAQKMKEAAEEKAIVELNDQLEKLREHFEKGGLFKEGQLDTMTATEVGAIAKQATNMHEKYRVLKAKLAAKDFKQLLEKISKLNREFVESGTLIKKAIPLVETQMTQATRLDYKLQYQLRRKLNEANRKKIASRLSSSYSHSNNFGIDYEKYSRQKHSYSRKTREFIEKAAIIDILDAVSYTHLTLPTIYSV